MALLSRLPPRLRSLFIRAHSRSQMQFDSLRPLLARTARAARACLCLLWGLHALAQTPQTITWDMPESRIAELKVPLTLKATSSSGLPVTFSLRYGPALLEGDQLKATNVGTIMVESRAPGSDAYLPATNRTSFNVMAVGLTTLGTLQVTSPDTFDARTVLVRGHFAYLGLGKAGIAIIDLQDPSAPKPVGAFDTDGTASGLDLVDQRLYVADGTGLSILDLTDLTHPVQLGRYQTNGTMLNVRVRDGLAYVAGPGGLSIVDVTQPADPVRLGVYRPPSTLSSLQLQDGFAFLAAGSSGLRIADITNPFVPSSAASSDTPGTAKDVHVVNNVAYIADGSLGIALVDVTQPYLPVSLGRLNASTDIRTVHLDRDVAVCASANGPSFVEVAPTHDLRLARKIGDAQNLVGLDLTGDLICALTATGELRLYRWRRGVEQTLSVPPLIELAFTNAPVPLVATASSGLPVHHSVISGPAKVVDEHLILTGIGDIELKVEQPGDAFFVAAPAATRSFRVHPNQSLTWVAPTNRVLKFGVPHRLQAVASSGLPVTYRVVTGPARIVGDEITITNLVASTSVIVAADQVGSDMYTPTTIHHGFNRAMFADYSIFEERGFNGLAFHVVGSRAYLGNWGGLHVLDIQDPQNWQDLGRAPMDYAKDWSGLTVAGDYAYMSEAGRGLYIFNISNPAQPQQVALIDVTGTTTFVLQDQKAFVTSANGSLVVLDVGDPVHPTVIGSLALGTYASSLQVRGHIAYVADRLGLYLVDVSQPAQPRLLGTVPLPDLKAVDVRDDLVAVTVGTAGLQVIDVRDPVKPRVLGQLFPFAGSAICVQRNLAFVVGPPGLRIVDLTDPTEPALVHEKSASGSEATQIQVLNGVAYWAERSGPGIKTVPVRPRDPHEIQWPDLPTALPLNQSHRLHAESTSSLPVNYRVISGPAYFSDGSLVITNLATVIVEAETLPTPGYNQARARFVLNQPTLKVTPLSPPFSIGSQATAVHLAGNRAHVLSREGGLHLLDVSNPAAIVELGRYPLTNAQNFHVIGNLAYVADQAHPPEDPTGGVVILDVSQAAAPTLVGRYDGTAQDVWVTNGVAYVADGPLGLITLNVSQPENPVKLGQFNLHSLDEAESRRIVVIDSAVNGPRAYVTTSEGGWWGMDITHPAFPQTATYNLGGYFGAPRLRGRLMFSPRTTQFEIWDVDFKNLRLLGTFTGFDSITALALTENFVYVAEPSGITLVEAANLLQLRSLTKFALPPEVQPTDIAVSGDLMFVTGTPGLFVYRNHIALQPTLDTVNFPSGHKQGESLALPAFSPEGFPLRYSIISGPGRIDGDQLRFTGPGSLVLRWQNDETELYHAAFAEQTLTIEPTVVPPPPTLTYTRIGETLRLTWDYPAALLETAPTPDGQWIQLTADSPFDVPITDTPYFFRVRPTNP